MKLLRFIITAAAVGATTTGFAQEAGLISWWTFSSDRQQGASIKAWHGGLNITPSGSYRFANEPPPARIELPARDERLLVAESIEKALLPKQDLTVEAWVRVDRPQEWGGIFSALQDNGDFERGLLLGYLQDRFCLGIATEAAGRLTYLAADTAFTTGHWYHVVGTYDGKLQRIFVNGRLAGESKVQSGAVWYPPSAPVVVGAYQDDNEFHRMKGALESIRVFQRALSSEEVATRYRQREAEFPAPAPEPLRLALPYGPFIDWVDRTTALVTWETDTEIPTRLELFEPSGKATVFGGEAPARRHEVRLAEMKRDTEYRLRLRAPDRDGREHATRRYLFDTSFHYQPAPLPAAAAQVMAGRDKEAALARELLERSGVRQGWGVVLGVQDGRVALELVRQSDLKLVIVESDVQRVADARKLLSAAGVYGVRASVHHLTGNELPYGTFMANLVVSESSLHSGEPPRWPAAEVHRILRPAGGVALLGAPAPDGAAPKVEAWNQWLASGELLAARRETAGSWWLRYERGRLPGAGDWSHQYGSADNTSTSLDEHVRGDLEVAWWGDPGPRPMPDRGPRNPAPLSVNGRLYIQGDRIVFGLDAYNGSVLWSVIAPEVRRANLPRDCSNAAADDTTLYLAHNQYCLEFDGQTGERRRRHSVPQDANELKFDWGYVAVVEQHLIGSRVKQEARYQGDDGEWFEDYHPDQVSRVVSETLFGIDLKSSAHRWSYRRGAILNSTITIGDGMIFFIESRNPDAVNAPGGRLSPDVLTDTHLVALDLRSGTPVWEQAQDFSKLQFMTYLVYSQNTLVATGTDKNKHFHTYAFNARVRSPYADESQPVHVGNQPLWSESHKEDKGHHSGHLQHPVVLNGVFYSDQRAFDLKTGKTLRTDLPERRGCGTMSASGNALFFRHHFHGMWDLETDKRSQFEGIRGGCWLGLIPAGGMLLAPETSAGCSCTHAIQTSVGYAPKLRAAR